MTLLITSWGCMQGGAGKACAPQGTAGSPKRKCQAAATACPDHSPPTAARAMSASMRSLSSVYSWLARSSAPAALWGVDAMRACARRQDAREQAAAPGACEAEGAAACNGVTYAAAAWARSPLRLDLVVHVHPGVVPQLGGELVVLLGHSLLLMLVIHRCSGGCVES